jgi:mono/diheme cytochrome c family protein
VAFAKHRAWGVVPPGTSGKESPGESGAGVFAGACATCHHRGSPADETPPKRPADLALSTLVNLPDPRNLIRVIVDGIMPEAGQRGPMMPGFADALTDQQVAALVGYLRTHFSDRPAWLDLAAHVREIRREKRP